MRTKAFAPIKKKLITHFGKQKFDLLPFGVESDNKKYLYGKTKKNDCFIVADDGEFVPKDEAIRIFKHFIRLWGVLVENANHIDQYLRQRPPSFYEKFNKLLDKLATEHGMDEMSAEIESIQKSLSDITKEQQQLKRNLDEVKRIHREKCKDGMFLEDEYMQKLFHLNERLTWSIYLIDRTLFEMRTDCRQLEQYLSKNINTQKQLFSNKIRTVKNYLKLFTSKKLSDALEASLQQFETDATGKTIRYSKGEKGFQQYVQSQNKAFAKAFNKDAVPLLMNE